MLSERLRSLVLNPLTSVSALMLIITPFLNWITELSFAVIIAGTLLIQLFPLQPTLWNFASGQAGINTTSAMPTLALLSAVLLLGGAIASLRYLRIGLTTAATGLLVFLIASYPVYGSRQNGSTLVIISPGLGPIAALVALIVGGTGGFMKPQRLDVLLKRLWSSEGIARTGLFIASVTLSLDALNHTALGQISAFLGTTNPVEEFFHLGFLLSFLALFASYGIRRKLYGNVWSKRMVVLVFSFLILDGAYHTLAGGLLGVLVFLGHNAAEITLHVLTYYGVALNVIALYFWKQEPS